MGGDTISATLESLLDYNFQTIHNFVKMYQNETPIYFFYNKQIKIFMAEIHSTFNLCSLKIIFTTNDIANRAISPKIRCLQTPNLQASIDGHSGNGINATRREEICHWSSGDTRLKKKEEQNWKCSTHVKVLEKLFPPLESYEFLIPRFLFCYFSPPKCSGRTLDWIQFSSRSWIHSLCHAPWRLIFWTYRVQIVMRGSL